MNEFKHYPGSAWVYSKSDIETAKAKNELLNCDIEITRKCNLKCKFCYSSSGTPLADELKYSEIIQVIDSAKNLGAKTITLTGGEPLLYPDFFDLVEYINNYSMSVLFFSNGTLITKDVAKKLISAGTFPCISLESTISDIHDDLVGVKGSHKKTIEGIYNLIDAGYTTNMPLTINAVVTSINLKYLNELWLWALNKNIEPFLLRLIPTGRSKNQNELQITPGQMRELIEKISKIKGFQPNIPFFGDSGCVKHHISCYVNSEGYVQPCSGLSVFCGNVRVNSLESIIKNSPILKAMRNINQNIHGKCKECEHHEKCYGCRGITYALTGDIAGSDPLCWH